MSAYYNEHDPKTAAWLRELIKAKLIADGEVDERSIELVSPDDVRGFTQCHFFAGIGGWSYALRLAGWSDDRAVWTGSCPCQPFSSAGKGDGADDPRHLWPTWFQLIHQCAPAVVFGEQVASSDGLAWLDAVCVDLEAAGYAIGAIDLGAASVGAPHIRQRLWVVAESAGGPGAGICRVLGANTIRQSHEGAEPAHGRANGELADTTRRRAQRLSAWDAAEWLECRDGKARPIKPGLEPLAYGLPARVGRLRDASEPFHPSEARVARLRGYGNAIVPQVAAEVIAAYMEITDALR